MEGSSARTISMVVLVVGIVLLVVGVMYLTIPADKLPSLLGQLHHSTDHRTKRAYAALVLGVVGVVIGGFTYMRMGRKHSLRHS